MLPSPVVDHGDAGRSQGGDPVRADARSIFERLSASEPEKKAEHAGGLAESLDALGLAYEGDYRLDQAQAAHEQAAAVWADLAAASPGSPDLAYHLAAALIRQGRLLCLKLGDPRGAQTILTAARGRLEGLVRDQPGSADYTRAQARAEVLAGVALSSTAFNDIDGATVLFKSAAAIRKTRRGPARQYRSAGRSGRCLRDDRVGVFQRAARGTHHDHLRQGS